MGIDRKVPAPLLRLCAAAAMTLSAHGLAACDGDAGATPDAGAATDAGAADAASADGGRDANDPASIVHVSIVGPLPENGFRILFHDPAGHIVIDTRTDGEGHASWALPEGGSVTWVHPNGFLTEGAVLPGEDISFVNDAFPKLFGHLEVEFTPISIDGVELEYVVTSPCSTSNLLGEDDTTLIIDLTDGCTGDSVDLTVFAWDRHTGTRYAAAQLVDVPAVPGTTVVAPPLLPYEHHQLAITGLPEGFDQVDIVRSGMFDSGNIVGAFQRFEAPVPIVDGALTADLMLPVGFAPDLGSYTVTATSLTDIYEPFTRVERARAWPTEEPDSLDVSTIMFPLLNSPTYADGLVSWVLPEGVEGADVIDVRVIVVTGLLLHTNKWVLRVPGDATEARLPDLPFDLRQTFPIGTAPPALNLWMEEADVWKDIHDTRGARTMPVDQPYTLRTTSTGG
jgi:hypothetical protein